MNKDEFFKDTDRIMRKLSKIEDKQVAVKTAVAYFLVKALIESWKIEKRKKRRGKRRRGKSARRNL